MLHHGAEPSAFAMMEKDSKYSEETTDITQPNLSSTSIRSLKRKRLYDTEKTVPDNATNKIQDVHVAIFRTIHKSNIKLIQSKPYQQYLDRCTSKYTVLKTLSSKPPYFCVEHFLIPCYFCKCVKLSHDIPNTCDNHTLQIIPDAVGSSTFATRQGEANWSGRECSEGCPFWMM